MASLSCFTPQFCEMSLASFLKDVTSVCPANPDESQRRTYTPRRLPRVTLNECAVDLLTLKCEGCKNRNCFNVLKMLEDAVECMVSARLNIVESGQRRSSEVLFKMLLPMRRVGNKSKRFQLLYSISGVRVCGDAFFKYLGLHLSDSRVKKVLAALRRGETHWVVATACTTTTIRTGTYATEWMRKYVIDYADQMSTACVFRIDSVEVKDLFEVYCRHHTMLELPSLARSRFYALWKELLQKGIHSDGILYKVEMSPGLFNSFVLPMSHLIDHVCV